jgi:hypothetical protein
MAARRRVAALAGGQVNLDTKDIEFDLTLSDRQTLALVATYGSAAQITSALGGMLKALRGALDSERGMATIAGERVEGCHIQKDRWKDEVILQLITPSGIPYTFGIPTRDAAQIAERLRIDSAKPTQTGNA